MIELGKVQTLQVVRKTQIGVYLNTFDGEDKDAVLLPQKQVPNDTEIGDEIEVFVYRDSKDRLIATVKKPKLTLGEIASLNVVEITKIGAFLDWGLEKDLFMPFKEQSGFIKKGEKYLVGLYIDKSSRLCATMRLYDLLSLESPYKENDRVSGTIYKINERLGAFVAVDNKYNGMIPNKEMYSRYNAGDEVKLRIKRVLPDGKLELSPRKEAYNEIESDTTKIMELLKVNNGRISLCDNSSPEEIKQKLGISKNAFKRAAGRLLKEGAIDILDDGIKLRW